MMQKDRLTSSSAMWPGPDPCGTTDPSWYICLSYVSSNPRKWPLIYGKTYLLEETVEEAKPNLYTWEAQAGEDEPMNTDLILVECTRRKGNKRRRRQGGVLCPPPAFILRGGKTWDPHSSTCVNRHGMHLTRMLHGDCFGSIHISLEHYLEQRFDFI